MVKQAIFKNFSEWWYYARILTTEQRSKVFENLSEEEKDALEASYMDAGYADVFCRNEINERLDSLKEKYGYDILEIRMKVLKGKSCYLPAKFWELLEEHMNQYKPEAVRFVMSGIRAIPCRSNSDVVLLVSDASELPDGFD